jgi:hypothetical protein
MERENLAGDAKGKGTSGANREAGSTDAPERGGRHTKSSPDLRHRRSRSSLTNTGLAQDHRQSVGASL